MSERPGRTAYLVERDGPWLERSWGEVGQEVDALAGGFLALGIRRGDRVAILGRTRLEWALCDWALISIGAIVVPIYPTSSALECAYILGNSGARFIVCEDRAQLEKVEAASREVEALERTIVFDALADLQERGREFTRQHDGVVERARNAIREDDILSIVYTSGTAGPPKGCVLTHRNYRAMVEMTRSIEGLIDEDDRILLFLPLAHTFARLVCFLGAATGAAIAFCPNAAHVADALRSVQPTLFPAVPRVYEKFAAAIRSGVDRAGGAQGRLGRWALAVGERASRRRAAGRGLGPALAFERVLADRLVLRRIRARFGGRLRLAVSGGAPLAKEVAEFFDALGVLVLEGYGLTECTTAATFNRPDAYLFGTVGLPLPGVEVRVAGDGEIHVRGENVFRGYYRDDDATRTTLSNGGWLATGDLGAIDTDGFLTITDRKKDIIVTAGGKNISPQNIELALKLSPYISEVVVIGDRRPYLVALVALDHDEIEKAGVPAREVDTLIEREVDAVNRDQGRVEQVRRFFILPRDLSLESRELTPTLKVRRHVCEKHFRDEIERLYGRESVGAL
ncbi:MAG: AMP-dependent synthetase/ligase [Gaiellaceae bacterium]